MDHSFVQAVQVLQQPDTGTAMYGRDEELYFADATVGEIEQFMPDLLVVKICEAVSESAGVDLYSGVVLDRIIFAGFALLEYFIHRFTAMTAKGLFVKDHGVFAAIFPAVVTARNG
jgi:hypothetical protein